jgi:hypothetical protein
MLTTLHRGSARHVKVKDNEYKYRAQRGPHFPFTLQAYFRHTRLSSPEGRELRSTNPEHRCRKTDLLLTVPWIKLPRLSVENLFCFGRIRPYVPVMQPYVRWSTHDYCEIIRIELDEFYESAPVTTGLFGYLEHCGNITQECCKR